MKHRRFVAVQSHPAMPAMRVSRPPSRALHAAIFGLIEIRLYQSQIVEYTFSLHAQYGCVGVLICVVPRHLQTSIEIQDTSRDGCRTSNRDAREHPRYQRVGGPMRSELQRTHDEQCDRLSRGPGHSGPASKINHSFMFTQRFCNAGSTLETQNELSSSSATNVQRGDG